LIDAITCSFDENAFPIFPDDLTFLKSSLVLILFPLFNLIYFNWFLVAGFEPSLRKNISLSSSGVGFVHLNVAQLFFENVKNTNDSGRKEKQQISKLNCTSAAAALLTAPLKEKQGTDSFSLAVKWS
jgi:hypothetical protein